MRPRSPLCACLLVLALGAPGRAPFAGPWPGTAPETLSELRQAVDAAVHAGLSARQLEDFAARWESVLAQADSPAEVASTALVARLLCAEGPPSSVRTLRARALGALCTIGAASGRARRMLVGDFLPRLERMPVSDQAEEVERYDLLLRKLAADAEDPALRAALDYSPIHLRLELARTWDVEWFDARERTGTLTALEALAASHATLQAPTGTTYAELARLARAEFVGAAFGTSMAELVGRDLTGKDLALADARGEVVLLVFWSSWCIPCLEAVPAERALAESFRDAPFRLLGVCADADAAAGSATATRTGMTWSSFHDGAREEDAEDTGTIARALGVRSWPSAFVFDREGRLRSKFLSTAFRARWTTADLAEAVRAALQETDR